MDDAEGPVEAGERRESGSGAGDAPLGPPRIPLPRSSVEDTGLPLPDLAPQRTPPPTFPQAQPTPPHDDQDESAAESPWAAPGAPSAPPDSQAPSHESTTSSATPGEPPTAPHTPSPGPDSPDNPRTSSATPGEPPTAPHTPSPAPDDSPHPTTSSGAPEETSTAPEHPSATTPGSSFFTPPGKPATAPEQPSAATPGDPSLTASGEPAALVPTPGPSPLVLEHRVLKALLGAWALAVCSPDEAAAVEEHLGVCGGCADEARRLREAVGLLHPSESLDLDPSLRTRVLRSCLDRRAPRIPVPAWAAPYDAEAARLDALLQDIDDTDWHAPVRLRWFGGEGPVTRRTTVAGVIAHLLTVDGLVATALGLEDPLEHLAAAPDSRTPDARTEAYWKAAHLPPGRAIRGPWREQSHDIVRTTSFRGGGPEDADGHKDTEGSGRLVVSYGGFELPLRDAMLDRAFECWIHAEDIAEAVDYPYAAPSGRHLHGMIDLAARMLPLVLAERRRTGLVTRSPAAGRHLVSVGAPGRSLRLEIEGSGGGEWLIPLDSPGAVGSAEHEVAHVALDGVEFCRLAAGHVSPEEAAAGQMGDRDAIRDVLFAAASMSRM
ncbi:zf-HC2 domain-containing protein [Streptomyces ossamyceticus]|uniref:zf-HC2 domain-containing protein n=1 Tax=Streptomyces ossamyceticus TaxID=249581 RepID=UPI0036E0429F